MATKKAALACSVCGSRNYSKSVSEGKKGERLEINKFCKDTFVVIQTTIIFALMFFVMDTLIQTVFNWILK